MIQIGAVRKAPITVPAELQDATACLHDWSGEKPSTQTPGDSDTGGSSRRKGEEEYGRRRLIERFKLRVGALEANPDGPSGPLALFRPRQTKYLRPIWIGWKSSAEVRQSRQEL